MLEEQGVEKNERDVPELLRHSYWMGYRDADLGLMEDPKFGTLPEDMGLKRREVKAALQGTGLRLVSGSSAQSSSTTADPGPSDDLVEFENEIAKRIPDAFDGDEGQQHIILKWLNAVEQRMKETDPKGHIWLFLGGMHPDEEGEWEGDDD